MTMSFKQVKQFTFTINCQMSSIYDMIKGLRLHLLLIQINSQNSGLVGKVSVRICENKNYHTLLYPTTYIIKAINEITSYIRHSQ
jgi:hypothetical protein